MNKNRQTGGLIIPFKELSPEALQGVIQEFVTRDGTDYGESEISLDTKAQRVLNQLHAEKAVIVFDQKCYSACNNDPVLKKSASKNDPPLIYTFHEIFHGGQEDVDSGNDSKNSAVLFCRGTEHQTDKQRPERIQKHGP